MKINAKNREGKMSKTKLITSPVRRPQISEPGSKHLELNTQRKQNKIKFRVD